MGNHTWQHERLTSLSREEVVSTVTRTQEHLGAHAAPCMRPPYGSIDGDTYDLISSLGLRLVAWTIDTLDWQGDAVEDIVSRLSQVTDGSIVLMHDANARTVEALGIVLDRWTEQGHVLERVCEPATAAKSPNTAATGSPTISGVAQVGQTLMSDASAVTDGDGIVGVTFSHKWLADNTEIAGATDSSYRVGAEHEGKSITVRVSFTDNAENQESLTSVPTSPAAAAEPVSGSPDAPRNVSVAATSTEGELVVLWDPPCCDNGSEVTGYRVEWKLSAGYWGGPGVTQAQTAGTSHTITGLAQSSQYAVRVRALNAAGAGVASEETLAAPSGTAPLLAGFQDPPASHTGSGSFTVGIAFSEAIANSDISMRDGSLDVTGGTVLSASLAAGRTDLWNIQVLPSGKGHVTIVLPAATDCATWGQVCTSAGKKLSNRLQWTVLGT